MEIYSGHARGVGEVKGREMSWAEQVDLAYPLEECWSESCLTDPHLCMEDHHRPEVRSGEEKLALDSGYLTLANGDPFALMKVNTVASGRFRKAESVVSLAQTRASLTYPLEELKVNTVASGRFRKAESVVSLAQTRASLTYPLEECWSESCLTDPHHLCMEDHHRPEVRSGGYKLDLDSWYLSLAYGDPFALMKVNTAAPEGFRA
ncbi:uncharacterized protein LOC121706180 isoform X1 [Alosa sapidissima]|uniref:uncharacterized protein LOC121706180 isoform X1 n=1 Tax=Alosa sapidissima TaxID=34773 RepID=UPI001C0A1239|nr:uncharacterized protein LOC121706180 isoform X1 [Alosa sapidissima]